MSSLSYSCDVMCHITAKQDGGGGDKVSVVSGRYPVSAQPQVETGQAVSMVSDVPGRCSGLTQPTIMMTQSVGTMTKVSGSADESERCHVLKPGTSTVSDVPGRCHVSAQPNVRVDPGENTESGTMRRVQDMFGGAVKRKQVRSNTTPIKKCVRSKMNRCLVHRCPFLEE